MQSRVQRSFPVDRSCGTRSSGGGLDLPGRRAVAEAEEVRRRIGEDRIFRLSGNLVDPYYGLIKTLWIKNNLTNVYRKAAKILNLKDFIVARLTGTLITDVSHAGLSGIAYDIRRNCWNNEVLKELELDPDKCPEPLPSDEIAGVLTADAASEFGLTPGTPVAGGGIDSAAGSPNAWHPWSPGSSSTTPMYLNPIQASGRRWTALQNWSSTARS